MRAFSIDAPEKTSIRDIPEPKLADGQVLLRVRRVGFCGTDLSIYKGKMPLAGYPRIPGHEIGATIEALGAGVPSKWTRGQEVTVQPTTACLQCSSCRAKRFNACRRNATLGVQRDGAMTPLIAVPHEKLFASPKLGLEDLALVEPFSIGFHAANRGRVQAGESVAVLGCGTIGLGAVAGAAHRGARVIGVDIDPAKLELAKRFGAEETVNSKSGDPAAKLRELTGGEGPDAVIEAIGIPQTYRLAVEAVAYCGRVVYVGYAKEEIAFDTKDFVLKELDLLGSRNALAEFPEVIAYFESGKADPKWLINRRVTLDEAGAALAAWNARPADVTKIMLALD